MTAEIMRLILLACYLSLVFTVAFFLRRRRLSLLKYATWGMIAILLPVVGPFLVIWIRPGHKQAVN
jgi:cytochrome bd-type quinol oxidase subunit 2